MIRSTDEASDALIFFGATGDLAYKQIFPALYRLVRDEAVVREGCLVAVLLAPCLVG